MFSRVFTGFIAFTLLAPVAAHAQTPAEYKDLEKMVAKLFEAYNKDDAKAAFADYFSAFQGQNAEPLYKAIFEPAKQKYGNYKNHKFVKDGSVKTDDIALLILNGQFAKNKAKVTVNFGKENNQWKIQQVTFSDE